MLGTHWVMAIFFANRLINKVSHLNTNRNKWCHTYRVKEKNKILFEFYTISNKVAAFLVLSSKAVRIEMWKDPAYDLCFAVIRRKLD